MKLLHKLRYSVIPIALIFTAVALFSCSENGFGEKQDYPERFSRLFYANNCVFYNDTSGNVCSYDVSESKAAAVIKSRRLVSAGDAVLCKDGDVPEVYDYDGTRLFMLPSLEIEYGEIHGDTLYYIDSTDGKIKVYDIPSGHCAGFFDIMTQSFCVSGEYLYYEKDDGIWKASLATGEADRVFDGRYCHWFCVDGDVLYVSDYENDSEISVIMPDGSTDILDVKAASFCVGGNSLYYIAYVNESDLLSIPQKRRDRGEIQVISLENRK